jgi:alpha-D-ribose 1-methylphosphonate 5-triphosphate synthase subunit PhnL
MTVSVREDEPMLVVEALAKSFEMHALGRRIAAFDGVSFSLRPGEFLLVTGPNGAGKSSLLRTLYRTYRADHGRALYRSRHGAIDLVRAADIDMALLRAEEMGFVTQFLQARPRLSAELIVAETLVRRGVAEKDALDAARESLGRFGLKPELWAAYPAGFSGGEQQKVNLARALLAPRRLLLLDEPTASLDAGARAALVERLAALKAEGTAILGVFHHPDDVRSLVDGKLAVAPAPAIA